MGRYMVWGRESYAFLSNFDNRQIETRVPLIKLVINSLFCGLKLKLERTSNANSFFSFLSKYSLFLIYNRSRLWLKLRFILSIIPSLIFIFWLFFRFARGFRSDYYLLF